MLKQSPQVIANVDDDDLSPQGFQNPLSGFDIFGAVRRQMWVILASTLVAAALGFGYLLQATPKYTSSANILIDAKNVGMTAMSPLEGSLTFETGAVDSQLQILKSDKLASSVAERLGLQNNMTFLDPPPSLIGGTVQGVLEQISSLFQLATGAPEAPGIKDLPPELRLLVASIKLQNEVQVVRVGRTYVFALEYANPDPQLAQAVVGQYVNAYLEDQLDSKFASTQRASGWMEERIRELRARSLAADEAVQKYRADNNLIAASGRLIDDQVLTDVTTQITAARSALDTASARYQRLKEIVDKQDVSAGLTESFENPNVAQLRSRYLEAAKLESDMSSRYGPGHRVAEKARKDMAEYQRLIFEELKNLLPGYQSDVSIAQTRVNSIQNTIKQLRQTNVANDTAMVKLRALEQESDSLRTLYSTFLQKYQEMQQQQSFPITDARVISEASVPILPSSPRKALILAASAMLGAMFGVFAGAFREWRDRGLRTAIQVRDELGLDFITNIPILENSSPKRLNGNWPAGADQALGANQKRRINTSDPNFNMAVAEPLSRFSEAIRAIKFKINVAFSGRKGVVIGIVSMFPDEGKSTIAKNLASSFAYQGTSTILVDGDVRNPSLTSNLMATPRAGLVDVVNSHADFDNIVGYEEASGLVFMPGATVAQRANDLFANHNTHDFIDKLRQRFDVVIIDLPPVGAVMDALVASVVVDGYIFIAQWGTTPRSVMREFVSNHPAIANKVLGVALNKVDTKQLERYGASHQSFQYGNYSEKYFSTGRSE